MWNILNVYCTSQRTQNYYSPGCSFQDNEIKRLLDELANQLKEYQNLQDIKVQLDMEIAVFRRLIESEEDRLGLGGQKNNKI